MLEDWSCERAGVVGLNDISDASAFLCDAMSILWFSDTLRLNTNN